VQWAILNTADHATRPAPESTVTLERSSIRRHAMTKRLATVFIGSSMLAMGLAACGTVTGAAVGAGAGAAVGAGTGYGAGKGALIGTGVGAAAGAIYDITKKR
jgi:YMGG-like Gly-zipper